MDNYNNQGTPVTAKTIHILDPRSPSENISRTPIEVRVSEKSTSAAASLMDCGNSQQPIDRSPLNVPPCCNLSNIDDSAEGTIYIFNHKFSFVFSILYYFAFNRCLYNFAFNRCLFPSK